MESSNALSRIIIKLKVLLTNEHSSIKRMLLSHGFSQFIHNQTKIMTRMQLTESNRILTQTTKSHLAKIIQKKQRISTRTTHTQQLQNTNYSTHYISYDKR